MCKVLDVMLCIALVSCIVAAGIAAAALIFDLDPEKVGTGYARLDAGYLELTLSEGNVPDMRGILVQVIINVLFGGSMIILLRHCVKCVLGIHAAMEEGQPFHSMVAEHLKKMAWYVLALGVMSNCAENAVRLLLVHVLDLPVLLLSERITQVTVHFELNLGFLLVVAVLLLLSHVFRYGQQLQQLSDETL